MNVNYPTKVEYSLLQLQIMYIIIGFWASFGTYYSIAHCILVIHSSKKSFKMYCGILNMLLFQFIHLVIILRDYQCVLRAPVIT